MEGLTETPPAKSVEEAAGADCAADKEGASLGVISTAALALYPAAKEHNANPNATATSFLEVWFFIQIYVLNGLF